MRTMSTKNQGKVLQIGFGGRGSGHKADVHSNDENVIPQDGLYETDKLKFQKVQSSDQHEGNPKFFSGEEPSGGRKLKMRKPSRSPLSAKQMNEEEIVE